MSSARTITRQMARNGTKKPAPKAGLLQENEVITTSQFYLLKWIACIVMLIGNIALFFRYQCSIPNSVYLPLIYISRLVFPLFAYLTVESFYHTKSRGRHLLRIAVIALLSEVPYDVLNITDDNIINFAHQSPCIALFLGFLCLIVTNKINGVASKMYHGSSFGKAVEVCIKINLAGVFLLLGYALHLEYGFGGVLLVILLGLARNNKYKHLIQFVAFLAFGLSQQHIAYTVAGAALVMIYVTEFLAKKHKDNPQKKTLARRFLCSKFTRRFTRIFYPFHMVILIAVRMLMVLNA